MGLFNSGKQQPPQKREAVMDEIPTTSIDRSKRYDVYCSVMGEERMYEAVKFVGIKTFHKVDEYSSGLVSGYLEIEAVDGARMMIPSFSIQLLCEHGNQPTFRVLRRWTNAWEG